MKALQVHKKNYLLLILFMSVLLAFQFPSLIRAESESQAAETEKIVSEAPKESIPEKDVAQQTEEKKLATAEEESIAETEPLPEEETLPEIDGVSTEETQSEPAKETEKAAESEQATDEEVLKEEEASNAEPAKEEESEEVEESEVLEQDNRSEKSEEGQGEKVLQAGDVLEISVLSEQPLTLGAGQGGEVVEVTVENFTELKDAIDKAEVGKKTKIIITASFDITETLTIKAGKDIVLTQVQIGIKNITRLLLSAKIRLLCRMKMIA